MNDRDKLYEVLRSVQEPKGYFFNKDTKIVLELLDQVFNGLVCHLGFAE